jgi:hypothetical protein
MVRSYAYAKVKHPNFISVEKRRHIDYHSGFMSQFRSLFDVLLRKHDYVATDTGKRINSKVCSTQNKIHSSHMSPYATTVRVSVIRVYVSNPENKRFLHL